MRFCAFSSIRWLLIVLAVAAALVTSCDGKQKSRGHRNPGGSIVQQHLTGRGIEAADAAKQASSIFVGRMKQAGDPDPGAPGQTYFAHAAAVVEKWLRTDIPEEKRPRSIPFAYTVQAMPDSSAEEAPKLGERYVFFLVQQTGDTLRAIKIISLDDAQIRQFEETLAHSLR